jgi:hypothetical protein
MPLYPLWQALLIRIFGTGPEGRCAVAFFASLAACLGFALFPKLSERSGLGPYAGVLAGLLGAFLPFNFFPQTEGGFETSFACLAIVLLLLWMKLWKDGDLRWPRAVACGAAMGAAGLLTPVLLPVIAVWLMLPATGTIWPADRRKDWLRFAILSCATAALLFGPWVIRNKLALGKPILTRSNFGLEMYKNNSDTSPPTLDAGIRLPEYQARGPYGSVSERARVRAMGEVAYNAEKLKLTEEWIRLRPRRFLVLTLERIWYYWFPSAVRPWQTTGEALVTILGLWSLFSRGWRGPTRNLALLSLVVFAVYPLVYYITAAGLRYRFPLEGLLIFWIGAAFA